MKKQAGRKDDKDKLRYDLLPVEAVEEVVRVLTFGAQKYEPHNWRHGIKYSRMYAATMRHLNKFWRGINVDEESHIHHLAHAACDTLMLLQYELESDGGMDDRFIHERK